MQVGRAEYISLTRRQRGPKRFRMRVNCTKHTSLTGRQRVRIAMTRGTAVALEMTVETEVMIQADNAEELAVTATVTVVVVTDR